MLESVLESDDLLGDVFGIALDQEGDKVGSGEHPFRPFQYEVDLAQSV